MIRKGCSNRTSIVASSSHCYSKEKYFAPLDLHQYCNNLYVHDCLLDLAVAGNDRYVPANGYGFQKSSCGSRSRLFSNLSRITMGGHRPEFFTTLVIPISKDSPT